MLESFHNAYLKDAFPKDSPCPVKFDVIEKYMQILLPAYIFNLQVQKNDATIAEVIPLIDLSITQWKSFQVDGEYKKLCSYLISAFNYKFEYELNSNVHLVSALLNTSRLQYWYRSKEKKISVRPHSILSIKSISYLQLKKTITMIVLTVFLRVPMI